MARMWASWFLSCFLKNGRLEAQIGRVWLLWCYVISQLCWAPRSGMCLIRNNWNARFRILFGLDTFCSGHPTYGRHLWQEACLLYGFNHTSAHHLWPHPIEKHQYDDSFAICDGGSICWKTVCSILVHLGDGTWEVKINSWDCGTCLWLYNYDLGNTLFHVHQPLHYLLGVLCCRVKFSVSSIDYQTRARVT